jgi:hypothetical protein
MAALIEKAESLVRDIAARGPAGISSRRGAVLPMERTAAARLANMLVSRSTTQAESVQVVLVNSESVELPSVRADPGCSRDFGRI